MEFLGITNALDLTVFPCISKRHCSVARWKGELYLLKENEIWEAALEVWKNLPNCKVTYGNNECCNVKVSSVLLMTLSYQYVIPLQSGTNFVPKKSNKCIKIHDKISWCIFIGG